MNVIKADYLFRLDVTSCVDVVPTIESKEVEVTATVITAHIGDITIDIPSDIDQTFLSKIFKCLKEDI